MTRSQAAGARTRQKKLSTKQSLAILREGEDEIIEDESQEAVPKVDTGVDKSEETEHHLQAALSTSNSSGKAAQIFIPTPDAIPSSLKYDLAYTRKFAQPATYIRFSSTVEDTSGAAYCLTEEDEAFLRHMNAGRSASSQCSDNQFEEVMQFFENTALIKQPYAAVDHPPVLGYEELESALEWDEILDESSKQFLRNIYPHWNDERTKMINSSIMPAIKVRVMEAGQDSEDSDPYVCFRRREPRHVRKTRGRDAQSTDKLKKLRKDLEDARSLLKMVKDRELLKMESLKTDRVLFEQRHSVKMLKRKLGIKGDDEDLINQKKKPKPSIEQLGQRSAGLLRMPPRPDGRAADVDTTLLRDYLAEKAAKKQQDVDNKIIAHRTWNRGFIDLTKSPLSAPTPQAVKSDFRTATTKYLPTPPASVSSETSDMADVETSPAKKEASITVRYASPPYDGFSQPLFRRRIGRGGRIMIDRRSMPLASKDGIDPVILDRYKYDQEDEDELPIYTIDPYDSVNLRYRASIIPIHHQKARPSGPMTNEQQAALAHAQALSLAKAQAAAGAATAVAPQVPSMTRS